MTDIAPWEQQPSESSRAYEAFRIYRDMAASERSYRKVAEQLGKARSLLNRWSSEHRWVERAETWDAEQDRLWRAEMAGRRRKAAERHLRTAELAQSKVVQRLLGLDPDQMTVTEATRLLDVTVRIERDALGEPSRHEVTGPGGSPLAVQLAEYAQMGAEQRRLAIADMFAAVQRRMKAAAGQGDDDDHDDDDDQPSGG